MSDRPPEQPPLGVVLAGGAARRLGRPKPLVELAGTPLIEYPLAALGAVLGKVVVAAKPDVPLDVLGLAERGIETWLDDAPQRHPLAGVVAALRRCADERILVCACDMPFVSAADVARLAGEAAGEARAAVAIAGGVLQPQLAVYHKSSLGPLERDLEALRPFTAAAAALDPRLVELETDAIFNVNTPDDLAEAARRLAQPGG